MVAHLPGAFVVAKVRFSFVVVSRILNSLALSLMFVSLVAVSLQSQAGSPVSAPTNFGTATSRDIAVTSRRGSTVHVTLVDENKNPLKQQALVRLTNRNTGMVYFQTSKSSEAELTNVPMGKYLLEVGTAGYVGKHAPITVDDVNYDVRETLTMMRDPAAVDLRLADAHQLP